MILGLIPARSGSKRIKNKNIYELNGKPLIQYTIEAAKNSKLLDDVIVSTDSKRIAEIANNFNINDPFLRPKKLSGDKIEMIEVIKHVVKKKKFKKINLIMLLQPTSPLRTNIDIDKSIKLFSLKRADTLVSVTNKKNIRRLIYGKIYGSGK